MTDKDNNNNHPVDALSLALDRSADLLASVGHLYDPEKDGFSGGNAFVAHALATVSGLVLEAKEALSDLNFCCDLTLLDSPGQSVMTVELRTHELADLESAAASESSRDNSLHEEFTNLGEAPSQQDDEFAQSYLELLRKLTAAEVFAAEQQALSVPGSTTQLLPLLKSLREDLQRLHSAA